MKRLLIVSFGLLLILSNSWAQGVSIVGTWYNPQYGVTMALQPNGAYSFASKQGTMMGRWSLQGYQFTMMEPSGRMIPYRVVNLTATNLQLVDAYGAQLLYQRAVGNQNTQKKPVRTKRSGPDKVLASTGKFKLMQSHIDAAVGLAEFIIGYSLPANEKTNLIGPAKQEFKQAPATFLSEIKKLEDSMAKLHQLTKPEQIAYARLQLTSAMWAGMKNIPLSKRPLLARIIFSHVKVLAFDEKNKLVLTDRDLNAMAEYLLFCHQLYCEMMYQKIPVSQAQVNKFKNDSVRYFAQIPLERKQFMCSATVAWTMLKANYHRLDSFQQGSIKGSIAARFPDSVLPPRKPNYNSASRYTPSGRKKSLAEMQREFQAKQNCFTIMNNMSLQNHATMLNTIENFGGTGNYWEVK